MPVSFPSRQRWVERYTPPWYTQPRYYVPATIAAAIVSGIIIYWLILAADLRTQAEAFDLKQLEQMESASVIVDRNDKIFGQIYVENRETVPYDQIPRDLINAVVAMEDNKFYQHGGYDLFGIIRAALKNFIAGHVRQGASTITQQLARNSFSLKERTFRRKLVEIFLARRIEEQFGKQKIMELYLNRIYFGGGLYGAEAASRGYFGKPATRDDAGGMRHARRLDQEPESSYRPGATRKRRAMRATSRSIACAISASSRAEQCDRGAERRRSSIGSRQSAQGQTYAVDYIRQQVIAAVGWDRAMNEGFRIHTTIDAELQKAAEESLRKNLDRAEQTPGYNHETYDDLRGAFSGGEENGHDQSERRAGIFAGRGHRAR